MLQCIDHPSSGIVKGLILTSGLVNHVGKSVLELLHASLTEIVCTESIPSSRHGRVVLRNCANTQLLHL